MAGPATGAQLARRWRAAADAGPAGRAAMAAAQAHPAHPVPEAKVFFHDLGTDTPLPKNLITGASVAGTS